MIDEREVGVKLREREGRMMNTGCTIRCSFYLRAGTDKPRKITMVCLSHVLQGGLPLLLAGSVQVLLCVRHHPSTTHSILDPSI